MFDLLLRFIRSGKVPVTKKQILGGLHCTEAAILRLTAKIFSLLLRTHLVLTQGILQLQLAVKA